MKSYKINLNIYTKHGKNERGFTPIVIATILALVLIGGVLAYVYFNQNNSTIFSGQQSVETTLSPSPSPETNAAMYDKHREKIQKDLNLSDVQFEILKKTVDE